MDYDSKLFASAAAYEASCDYWDDLVYDEWEIVKSNDVLYSELIFEHAIEDTVTVDDGTEMMPLAALVKYAPGWLRAQIHDRLDKPIERNAERRAKEEASKYGGYDE